MMNIENNEVKTSRVKKISSFLTIGIFLVVVMGLFMITVVKPDKEFSENENRVLAGKPEFSLDNLFNGSFTRDYESYLTDQFIERDSFIAMKVYAERALGKKAVNGVYFAPKNYLIEEHKKRDIDETLATTNIKRVEEFVQTYKDTMPVNFMLVPTASNVYPEWLPSYNVEYDQNLLIKQATEAIGLNNTIDASEILRKHKDDSIFYKTDHHWTSLGAYYGYTSWAEKTGIKPYSLEQFDRKVVAKDFLGTTYSKVNIKEEADEIELFELKDGPKLTMSTKQDGSNKKDGLYSLERLKEKDKYTVFLGGNNPYVEINSNLHNGKTLLMIQDSFAHCMVPFLANHYEKIILLDYRYFNNSTKQLINEKNVSDILIMYNVINFVTDMSLAKLNK